MAEGSLSRVWFSRQDCVLNRPSWLYYYRRQQRPCHQSDRAFVVGASGEGTAHKKIPDRKNRSGMYEKRIGSDLLSHTVSHAVPSALRSLTSVFGMGTGGTSSLWPPKYLVFSLLFLFSLCLVVFIGAGSEAKRSPLRIE